MPLPAPLEAFRAYPQFVNWILVPGDPKPKKLPIGTDGKVINAHDPANWLDADTAYALAEANGYGWGVGFVLTEADPFFFGDIDHCMVNGEWSELAVQVCNTFSGAAVEVSQSGEGLHVLGIGQVPAGFKKKNNALGLEIYSEKRMISLGSGATGDAGAFDWTATLAQWVPAHFEPYVGGDLLPAEWTVLPRADYTGPADDAELIQRMLSSTSASAKLGAKATIQQLWEAKPEVLAEFYPDPGVRPYDASGADAALVAHLAFWTGCNCDRMERLMRQSGLVREKWDKHKSYMSRTILGAVARCSTVYSIVQTEQRYGVMILEEMQEYFKNCVYVASSNKIFQAEAGWIKPDAFKQKYGGHDFVYTMDGKSTRNALEAFTQSQITDQFLKVDDVWFRPDLTPLDIRKEKGVIWLNIYVDPCVPTNEHSVEPFLNWLKLAFPDERDQQIILSYIAACVQNPGEKFFWAPVIQGVEGNGKTMLSMITQFAIGGAHPAKYCHSVAANNLEDGGLKFNSWVENRLFIEIDEIHTRDKVNLIEALKPYITNEYMEIQGKGADQRYGRNCANFMLFSNHRDAIKKTENDRRYAVFFMGQQTKSDVQRDMPGDFLPDVWDWLRRDDGYEAVAGYLRRYEISDEFNPAGLCHRAPVTSSTGAAMLESLGTVEQEVLEWVAMDRPGFIGGWISSHLLDVALREAGYSRRVPVNRRRDMLDPLGYVPHPILRGGRSSMQILQESNSKPVLYRRKDRTGENGFDPKDVMHAYLVAQGYSLAD